MKGSNGHSSASAAATRFLGIDLGAETIKLAEVVLRGGRLTPGRTWRRDHGKAPARALPAILKEADWNSAAGAAATGRMARLTRLKRVPMKAAVAEGLALLHPELPACTVVSIGGHGFAVVEVLEGGRRRLRENSRCSQGTGNFLRQLVDRLGLELAAADRLCEDADAAPLSGRCPVILKTDMTHLANKGVDRGRILAGLYDAVCENVQALLRSNDSPPDLMLIGGVARSKRIRRNFQKTAARLGMRFCRGHRHAGLFLEAFGAARLAALKGHPAPPADKIPAGRQKIPFTTIAAPSAALARVRRMKPAPVPAPAGADVLLGFDIGSTGSKALAIDAHSKAPLWRGYLDTLGDPVDAARRLAALMLRESGGRLRVRGFGATGSGREITGSLLAGCFGAKRVFILNEIAAHAEGALHYDARVDTIFEIGGQDAKYIRLVNGRIIDAAMNEACSAGTGSFIAEQGSKFKGVGGVVEMGAKALAARTAVSLGQHCSVFMAEVIDQAVAAGESSDAVLAGLYDSVTQNYLNRVKGSRSVGERIFCQGMPFMSDALAAAAARRTGRDVVIPPDPGTVGALGIALLAAKELAPSAAPLDLNRFLGARVEAKDRFSCRSTKGCGAPGNRCRIDRLKTTVEGRARNFLWGGNCSLYDRGTSKRKLPGDAPDPFRQREALVDDLLKPLSKNAGAPVAAMTDAFSLKGLAPFFAAFVDALGFDVRLHRGGRAEDLKEGIQHANIPYCAPLQMLHGITARMLASTPDILLLPMVRQLPRAGTEPYSVSCPVVQGAPGLIGQAFFRDRRGTKRISTTINMAAGGLESEDFRRSTRTLAGALGADRRWERAYRTALKTQRRFNAGLARIGRDAVAFAKRHNIAPVIVLGRTYTIYNDVLNSNVPNLLREQGALAIPVDAYPVGNDTPCFESMYWHHGQRNLRAAHRIRRENGVYSVFCSNYACGPDSFTLHFYAHIMEGRPFALIETDGHSGDAGTKTRIEAFLYCVEGERSTQARKSATRRLNDLSVVDRDRIDLPRARRDDRRLLINDMGPGSQVLAAALRGEGFRAEVLPSPDRLALETGRRHTSGKECVPLTLTLGALLRRLESERSNSETFAALVPASCGPCRYGVYHLLYKLILARTGWSRRVRIVSPSDDDYFAGLPADFSARVWAGFVAADALLAGLHYVRPAELRPGAAQAVFDRRLAELLELWEHPASGRVLDAFREASGGVFGAQTVIRAAAADFARVLDFERRLPTIGVLGEIYVRLNTFANGGIIDLLERAGMRTRLAPLHEWLEYLDWLGEKCRKEGRPVPGHDPLRTWLSSALLHRVADRLYAAMGGPLGWGARTQVRSSVAAGSLYVSPDLEGEAILTLGAALHEYLAGEIDGALSVGPLECMPSKITQSHFQRADLDCGLPSLTLSLNGEPPDARTLEAFVYEVTERLTQGGRSRRGRTPRERFSLAGLLWRSSGRLASSALGSMRPMTAFRRRGGRVHNSPTSRSDTVHAARR